MKATWKALCLGAMVLMAGLLPSHTVQAEGFAMTEWSSRGLGLASGMVGRADDASALAYNAAGITQLEGTHLMVGGAVVAPMGAISLDTPQGKHTTETKPRGWTPAHFYLTHQMNDKVWLGLASFTRFGLGVEYGGAWPGRYNMYDVALQTVSVVPTIAVKVNDWLSLSLGGELLYGHFYEGTKLQPFDSDLQVDGQGIAGGVHLGAHVKFNEQWSAGLAYKSQMTLNMAGDAVFEYSAKVPAQYKAMMNTSNVDGTIQLPDSLALGITYKPLDNLSFEVGTVWTRWSVYDHLNLYFDKPFGQHVKSQKNFKDGWNFNASVEWKPYDWWALRAGAYYETPVADEKHADFIIPSYGRTGITLGTGFVWNNFTVDIAYAHLFINPLSYDKNSELTKVSGGKSENCVANIYSVSIGYTF
ncbi:MAG: outer membrane protein transport protein [Desulfovibrionaceae bacterium]|nr:outer membrane protein transport protein [Desulfovibrionaceae bacterium]